MNYITVLYWDGLLYTSDKTVKLFCLIKNDFLNEIYKNLNIMIHMPLPKNLVFTLNKC